MGFLDNQTTVPGKIIAQIGDLATFTDVGGEPITCRVVVEKDVLLQASGYDINIGTLGTTIDALVSDVGFPTIATNNKSGAVFVIGDDTWSVREILRNDGMIVVMVVKAA